MIEEILEVDPARMVKSPIGAGGRDLHLLERRGEAVPIVRLDDVLSRRGQGAARKALVVRRNGNPFAFGVDRMLGQQEVVVRPLEDTLVRAPGVTGATDLGDGRPTLVLDLLALAPSGVEAQA